MSHSLVVTVTIDVTPRLPWLQTGIEINRVFCEVGAAAEAIVEHRGRNSTETKCGNQIVANRQKKVTLDLL